MEQFNSIWRIENYSYCWHRVDEELISPQFFVDMGGKTVWTMSCFPRGLTNGDYIGFYLNRSEAGFKPSRIAVNYELSFQAADGTLLKTLTSNGECEFGNVESRGKSEFVNRYEVLVGERHRYLAEDTLIARCRMWIGSGSITKTVQSTARTRICVESVAFVETFERFSEMQPDLIRVVPVKTASEAEPAMSMSISLEAETLSEVTFKIDVVSCTKEIPVCSCMVYLLDRTGNQIQYGRSEFTFLQNQSDHWTFPLSLPKKDLMHKAKECLPLDTLSLLFQFAFSTQDLLEEIEETLYGSRLTQTSMPLHPLTTETSIRGINASTISESSSALEDLKSLYNDQVLCDVRFKTETQTFPAHKTVLCARSPVFRAMFTSDMKENLKDCIEVEDLEDDTLRQFLLFLYTDQLEDIPWKTASRLYYAADKYQVKMLKNKCSSVLIDNLEVSNASDVLLLADMHQDSDMRKIAEDFILERDEAVFSSEEWISFTKSSPQLAMDTMLLKYRKQ